MGGNLLESLIGAVVLVVAGGFLVFAYSQTELRAVDGYEVTAEFSEISGLTTGADVRLSGIKVGTVTGQSLDPKTYQAEVRMSIDPAVDLPADSSARITSEGLLGGYYVSLTPGGSPDMLEPGGEIEFTQGAVNLMSLISQAVFQMSPGDGGQESGSQGSSE